MFSPEVADSWFAGRLEHAGHKINLDVPALKRLLCPELHLCLAGTLSNGSKPSTWGSITGVRGQALESLLHVKEDALRAKMAAGWFEKMVGKQ